MFDFVRDAGDAFLDAYVPIVERRKDLAYTPEQRFFQEFRRGPVRGVQPGLRPRHGVRPEDGRPDGEHPDEPAAGGALRVRLPPRPRVTREAELTEYWLKPKDWAGMEGWN